MEIKKVALIGLGSIGSFLAPRLEQALGHDAFRVVAGGERKEKLHRRGVTINGENWHFALADPQDEPDWADLVIVTVKYGGLPRAIEDIRNQVGPDTTIVSFMNGVTSERMLAEAYGWEKLIYGMCRVSVAMVDQTVTYDPAKGTFYFGEKQNDLSALTPRVAAIAELFTRAGIPYQIDEDMIRTLWLKFMANVSENQISAVLGIPFGAWQVSDHANALREDVMREVIALAKRQGINLTEQDLINQRAMLQKISYPNKSSMLQDIEQKRKTEVEMFSGEVLRLGKELGVPTPINQVLYHQLHVLEEKNEGKI